MLSRQTGVYGISDTNLVVNGTFGIPQYSSNPASSFLRAGSLYYNTGTSKMLSYDGTTWAIGVNEPGSTAITTLGTITTGVWSANTIAVNKGGTGATTLTGLVKGSGTSAFTAAVANTDYLPVASPVMTTPTLGVAAATSINKVAITTPATSATLTIINGKTFTSNNTLALSGTDGSTLNIGAGGTLGSAAYTASTAYEVPLTFSSPLLRTSNTISIPAATTSINGYLTSTDWNVFNGKISNPMTTLGDIIYGGASGVSTRLAGNTTTTKMFLTQTGNGTISAAPTYFDLFGTNNTWSGANNFTAQLTVIYSGYSTGIGSTGIGFYSPSFATITPKITFSDIGAGYASTITPTSTLTGNRIITSPDASGTMALTNQLPIANSFSGVGTATTTFTVTIGSTMSNNTYKVTATPTNLLSAAVFYINNKTTTTFDVVYLAGLTGTVAFDWILAP